MRSKVKFLTLGVVTACLALLSFGENLASYVAKSQQALVPEVSVSAQANAPLRINVLSYNSSDPQNPEVVFEVTNVGDKPIGAYAFRQVTRKGTEKTSGSTLTFMDSVETFLQPGQYRTESISYQPLSQITGQVVLSIDFVEFVDGTSWGPNLAKSAELVAGRRAAMREEAASLLRVYERDGLQAVIKIIKANTADITPPANDSPEWKAGFRHGVGSVSKRLKRILDKDGPPRVEIELRRLSDRLAQGK
jgi:hypothetical protein